MRTIHRHCWMVAAASVVFGAACTSMPAATPKATARLAPTTGNSTRGTVTFTPNGDKVRVVANVTGLTPGGHGFHIHDKGDCSAPDATSAGAHFNPTNKPHGNPAAGEHHGGDMPMLEADASGNAKIDVTLDTVTLGTGPNGIVGRSVVVHKDVDDYRSQPAGNSGARIACGPIVAA